MRDALFRGLVVGENPTVTARAILDETETAFFGGLPRAKTIARTEIADAHRYASKLAYNASDLVIGWKWLASLGPRTCPACWALHNTFHEKSEIQFAHQNCRCTQVPVLVDDDVSQTDLGDPEELFWGLPREQQLAIMGPGRLQALEGGAPFSSLAFLKHNPDWRPAFYSTNVADLRGLADLNLAHTVGDVLGIPGQSNQSILDAAFHQGGLTIQTTSGKIPTSGVAVAQEGASGVFDAREFFGPSGPLLVSDWMIQHGDALDSETAHMGVWYDHANGKVVLDVVDVLKDREAAIALGKQRDQIAVFDLGTFEEIPTGGTGGYANGLETALRPKSDQVGKHATIVVDGVTRVVTITKVPDYTRSVTVKDDSGNEFAVWPDQILSVSDDTTAASQKAKVQRVSDLAADTRKQAHLDVRFNGLDDKGAQELHDETIDLVHDYGVRPTSISTGTPQGAYAVTNTQFPAGTPVSDIVLNREFGTTYQSWKSNMTEDVENGHFHAGTADHPARYTLDHEYGHVLSFNLFGDPSTDAGWEARGRVMADVRNALYAKEIEAGAVQPITDSDGAYRAFGGEDQELHRRIQSDLSGYGDSQYEEMVAEAYAVYRNVGAGKSVVADTVMRDLVNRYREKYGHDPDERDLTALVGRDENQLSLFSKKIGQAVGLSEAKEGLRVTVNGDFGTVVSRSGSRVKVKFDDGTTRTVYGGDLRHALRRNS
jgi:hypothetical protein